MRTLEREYSPEERKKILILYRATHEFRASRSSQSTIRYYAPRMSGDDVVVNGHEFECAEWWWERVISANEKAKLELEYKFAAKVK